MLDMRNAQVFNANKKNGCAMSPTQVSKGKFLKASGMNIQITENDSPDKRWYDFTNMPLTTFSRRKSTMISNSNFLAMK